MIFFSITFQMGITIIIFDLEWYRMCCIGIVQILWPLFWGKYFCLDFNVTCGWVSSTRKTFVFNTNWIDSEIWINDENASWFLYVDSWKWYTPSKNVSPTSEWTATYWETKHCFRNALPCQASTLAHMTHDIWSFPSYIIMHYHFLLFYRTQI